MGGGPPGFPQDFTCLVVLRILSVLSAFRLQDYYLLRLIFPNHSTKHPLRDESPTTPIPKNRFGLFPLRSPLLGESSFLSLPPGT